MDIIKSILLILILIGPLFFLESNWFANVKKHKLSSYERENIVLADYALNCLNIDNSKADQYSRELVECISISSAIKANQAMYNKYIARICL